MRVRPPACVCVCVHNEIIVLPRMHNMFNIGTQYNICTIIYYNSIIYLHRPRETELEFRRERLKNKKKFSKKHPTRRRDAPRISSIRYNFMCSIELLWRCPVYAVYLYVAIYYNIIYCKYIRDEILLEFARRRPTCACSNEGRHRICRRFFSSSIVYFFSIIIYTPQRQ